MRRAEHRSGWAGDVWPEGGAGPFPAPAEPAAAPDSLWARTVGPVLRAGWVRQTLAAALMVGAAMGALRAPAPLGPVARRGIAWALGYNVDTAALGRQASGLGGALGLTPSPAAPAPTPSPSPGETGGAALVTPMGRLLPPAAAPVSAWFGWREVAGRPRFNPGIDLSTPVDTRVRAVADGTVERLRPSIVLRHVDGWQSVYGRCTPANLRAGQAVRQGAVICRSSAGGLLFQLLVGGRAVDPAPYLGLKAPAHR